MRSASGSPRARPAGSGPAAQATYPSGRISIAAAGWHDRVSVTAARPLASPAPAAAMLIRPDGYVAWAAGPETAGLARGLPEALCAWFGEPG